MTHAGPSKEVANDPVGDRAVLEFSDARMNTLETVVWTVPGLALGGQAFLLAVTLATPTSEWARLLAAGVALVIALATCGFFATMLSYYNIYREASRARRVALRLPPVEDTDLKRHSAGWDERLTRLQRAFARVSSVQVWWRLALILLLLDAAIFALAIVDVAGGPSPLW